MPATAQRPVNTSRKHHPPALWDQARTAYLDGQGTVVEVAEQLGIPANTARKRAEKEGWVSQRKALRRAIKPARALANVTQEHNLVLVKRRESWVARTLDIFDAWIEQFAARMREKLTVTEFARLSDAFCRIVDAGRRSHGLGSKTSAVQVNVTTISQAKESSEDIDV